MQRDKEIMKRETEKFEEIKKEFLFKDKNQDERISNLIFQLNQMQNSNNAEISINQNPKEIEEEREQKEQRRADVIKKNTVKLKQRSLNKSKPL